MSLKPDHLSCGQDGPASEEEEVEDSWPLQDRETEAVERGTVGHGEAAEQLRYEPQTDHL